MCVDEVREILLTDWDPLNVEGNPHLRDEYDRYIPGVVQLIRQGRDAAVIAQYLRVVEARMGIRPLEKPRLRTAARLATVSCDSCADGPIVGADFFDPPFDPND